jgi:predicted phage tail protein
VAFKLPSITSAIPRDLRSFCDRVREALNAQGNDRIITRRDLIATGVVVVGPGNTLQPTDPTELAKVKYDTPPAPTGLATSGAIANIILTWDAPKYVGHSYTEIFVADTNTFADRVKLADVLGLTYSHSVGAATTKYYWIRFVNVAEVPGPLQLNYRR